MDRSWGGPYSPIRNLYQGGLAICYGTRPFRFGTFLASLARLYNSNLQPPLRCYDTPPLRHIPLAAHLQHPFGDIPSYVKHWHPFDNYSKGYAKDMNDAWSALLSHILCLSFVLQSALDSNIVRLMPPA